MPEVKLVQRVLSLSLSLSLSLKKVQYFLEGRKREDPGNEFGVCSGRGYCVVFLVQGPSPTSTSLHPVVKMDTDKL